MIAFDSDILTELLFGNSKLVDRAARIPVADQAKSVVVDEKVRGRLNMIRRAEAGKGWGSINVAYQCK